MKQYPNSPYVAKAHELLTLIGKERKTQLWKRFLSRSDGIYRFSAESSNVNNKRTIRFLVKIASGRETGELTSLSTTTNGSMYFLMPMKGDLVWSKTVPGAFWLNSTSKDVLDNQLFYIGDETLVMSRVGMFGDGPTLRFDGTTQ